MAQGKRLTKEEIEKDQFTEIVLSMYDFLQKNAKPILTGAVIVIVVIGGFVLYQQQQKRDRAEIFLKYTQAVEKYQEVENDWLDPEKSETSREHFQAVGTQFQTILQTSSGISIGDKARFNYAKTLYYQEDYNGAIAQFQEVIEKHQPDNQILALYAQKAIGNCYEQQSEYEKAIEAYIPAEEKLPSIAIRDHTFADFRLSQARCYEKLERFDDALAIYQDVIDLFRENLENAIQKKSLELIPRAKSLVAVLPQPPSTTEAERLENQTNHYDAFVAYAEAIHNYKVDRDIHGGLTRELREGIQRFETVTSDFLKNLRDARRSESEGRNSTALYYYGQSIGLDFAPSRKLYEKSLLCRDKIQRE